MTDTIKAVLVGCGGIAGAWINAAKEQDHLEIAGFVDLDADRAKKRAEDNGTPDAFCSDNMEKAISETGADAVFNCTIPAAHKEVTVTALKKGCHVLSEKPLADSLEAAREMVDTAAETGKIFSITQNYRYRSQIRAFSEYIKSGELGDLTTLYANFIKGIHFDGFRREMDHVLLIDMAIHTFDASRLITGADPVSVYCHEFNPKGSWYRHGASAIVTFEMSDGIVLSYRGSWTAEGLNTSWNSTWHAVCETGSAFWDGEEELKAEKVTPQETGGTWESETVEIPVTEDEKLKKSGHAGPMEDFLTCVRHGGTPETAGSDNIKSLAMVFKAIESAEKGEKILF